VATTLACLTAEPVTNADFAITIGLPRTTESETR